MAVFREERPVDGHGGTIRSRNASHQAGEMPDKLTLLIEGHRRMKTHGLEIPGNLQAAADQVHPGCLRFSTPEGDAVAPQRGQSLPDGCVFLCCVTTTCFATDRLQLGLVTEDKTPDLRKGVLERPVIDCADQCDTVGPVATGAYAAA